MLARTTDNTPEARIGKNITPHASGCWFFRDDGDHDRYSSTTVHGQHVYLHRWVYETCHGKLDDGLVLHHKCETKACCNPAHLEPMEPHEHLALHRSM